MKRPQKQIRGKTKSKKAKSKIILFIGQLEENPVEKILESIPLPNSIKKLFLENKKKTKEEEIIEKTEIEEDIKSKSILN